MVRLVATIPCHNDAEFLEAAVIALKKEIEKISGDSIIVIAEDGSTDGSIKISRKLAAEDSEVYLLHAEKKLGRGRALMNAWMEFDGEIYAYIDCDLATDMRFFPQLVSFIMDGYDLVTGSRYVEGAVCERPWLRGLSSVKYNALIRLLFKDGVYDHQCGFKAFSRKMVDHILAECRSGGWFWDTESIVLAYRGGFRIKEFPVSWEEKKGNRTPLIRLFKDAWIHGKGVFGLLLR